jgi:type II protein arginine methyltransferase
MSQDAGVSASTWRWWDTLRTLCSYKPNLGILLEVSGSNDLPAESFNNRWVGEPVRGLLLSTAAFLRNKRNYPVLPKSLQNVVSSVYKIGQQVCF